MVSLSKIDISENSLRNRGRVLDILLVDRTRHKPSRPFNIIWATDSYSKKYGKDYSERKQIKREQVTGINGKLIQPRAAKSMEEQKYRTKDKAEVFTPLSVVDQMNKVLDKASKNHPVNKLNWKEYVSELRLEITCGEAPFITGRYNPTAHTDIVITPKNRVGFFDRKLQQVNKYANSKMEWLEYAEIALKATYGYEWQGDNLLIARENILLTLDDYYRDFCVNKLKLKSIHGLNDAQLEYFAEIISWNIFQMDGLNYTIPMTRVVEKRKVIEDGTGMFSAEMLGEEKREYILEIKKIGHHVKIMDWEKDKAVKFVDLVENK